MEFSIKNYEQLQTVEPYLRTVHNSHFKRATTLKEDETVQEVMTELGYPKTNLHCAKCVYNMYAEAAKHYFKFVNDLNQATKSVTYKTAVTKNGKKTNKPKA